MDSSTSGSHYTGPMGGDMPDLSDILLAGEKLCFVARGRVLTSRVPRFGRWFIIVTTRRLILLKDEARPVRQQWHVVLAGIESAYQEGWLRSKVVIRTRHGRFYIRGLSRFSGAQLVSWLIAPRTGEGMAPQRPRMEDVLVAEPPPTPVALLTSERVLTRIEDLEADVDRLGKQVRFLEELLESRQATQPLQLKSAE